MTVDWPALQFQTSEPSPVGVTLDAGVYALHQKRGQDRTWVVELSQDTVNGTTCYSLAESRIDGPDVASTALTASGSAWEAVWTVNPAGGTPTWVGVRAHGYEQDQSLTVTLDGAPVTPTDTVTWADEAVITRTSTLSHPDAAVIGTVVTTYRMTREGLDVTRTVTWGATLTGGQCYGAMLPGLEVLDTGKTLTGAKATLTASDDSVNSSSQSRTAWLWDADGDHGMCMALLDLATVADWAYTDSKDMWLQDRSGGSINKVYAGFTGRNATSGDVWTSEVRYLADYFDGGAAATLDK